MSERVLQVRFVGNTSDLAGNIEGVQGKFGVLAKGVAAAGAAVGVGLVAAGKGLLDIGATFDSMSDTIRTQTGATGAQLDSMVASAKNVGTQVPSSFEDVGAAVAGLNQRLGITGPNLESMAAQVLDLSRLTGTDLTGNIEGLTRLFGDWGIKTEDMSGSMDKLFVVSQKTGVGVTKLSESMTQFGAPMRQLGFSFDQTAALLGKFEKEGVNAELVMGAMRKSLGKMAKAGEDPITTFARISESIKAAGSTMEANKIAVEMFGAKAGPDMAAAIREGRFAIDDLLGAMGGSSGAIRSASADTADFAEQWQILKNKVFVALEPVAARVFGMVNQKMSQLADWFNQNQASIQSFVGALGAGFGGLLTAVGTIVGALVSFGLAVATATGWVRDHWVVAMLIALPLLLLFGPHLIALGVTATISMAKVGLAWLMSAGTATVAAATHSLALLGTVGKFGVLAVAAMASMLRVAAAWALSGAAAVAGAALGIAMMVAMVARFAWMGVQALIHGARVAAGWVLAMGPVGWVIATVIGLVALIVANWDRIVGATEGLRNRVVSIFWAVIDFIKGIPGAIMRALGNLASLLYNSGTALVDGFLNGIKARWNSLVSWVKQGMANLRNLWPFSPAKTGPFSGRGYVTYSGRALTADFAASIRRGIPNVISAARRVISAAKGGLDARITGTGVSSVELGAARAPVAHVVVDSAGSRIDDVITAILRQALRSEGLDATVVGGI
jgi:hypothetical protein